MMRTYLPAFRGGGLASNVCFSSDMAVKSNDDKAAPRISNVLYTVLVIVHVAQHASLVVVGGASAFLDMHAACQEHGRRV